MTLTGVTLTGADESILPDRLVDLSEEFPFVEWGILVGSRTGNRFPEKQWITELTKRASDRKVSMKLSLHICGRVLQTILSKATFELRDSLPLQYFQRAQLNFHGDPISVFQRNKLLLTIARNGHPQWPFDETIVQLDGENDSLLADILERQIPASGLYDRSHGAGVVPFSWPVSNPKWKVGYAGGLSPDNLVSELEKISAAAGAQNFWIDMETKLRNKDDEFDDGLIHSVLVLSEPHFKDKS